MINRTFVMIPFLALIQGCAHSAAVDQAESINWSQISQHSSQRVKICGWLRAGMEECSLSAQRGIDNPLKQIWVVTNDPVCLPENAIPNPTQHWAEVEGEIVTGESYGHLGLYFASIAGRKIVLRDRPCEEATP